MNVLIVEDEQFAAERLERMIENQHPEINVVATTDSIRETLEFLDSRSKEIDLIFCDIQLADGTSFEIFEQKKVNQPVIFTTAYDEYSLDAFKLNSVHYLLKPISKTDLASAIDKYEKIHRRNIFNSNVLSDIAELTKPKRFLVKSGLKLIPKKEKDVAIFYISNKVIQLLDMDGKSFITDFSLEELEKDHLSSKQFFRTNRKHIINKDAITSIKPFKNQRLLLTLSIPNTLELVVSREKVNEFKQWFLD